MWVKEQLTGHWHPVVVEPVAEQDYRQLTRNRFWFNWSKEKPYQVYKLCLRHQPSILGLVSYDDVPNEKRLELRLLAASKENTGVQKQYQGIAGNLVAWVCRQALKQYAAEACVSLVPKTSLARHYVQAYGMQEAGRCLFLDNGSLLALLEKYEV